jgi:hypothetical protein
MLLRISLGIAILAGIGALYFSQMQLAPKITTLTGDLQTAQTERQTAQDNERKAKDDSKKARSELDVAKKDITEKSAALETTTAKLAEQQTRGNQLSVDLTKVTGERNDAQADLARWQAAGVTVDQIGTLKKDLAKVSEERDVITGENKILLREKNRLQTRLDIYEGDREKDPEMPAGLKGKVLVVDSKYDFVVIDIGGNQGAVERGKLLISRAGKLVGAVRITRVEANRCIANVIPEMKQAEVVEGDQVVY